LVRALRTHDAVNSNPIEPAKEIPDEELEKIEPEESFNPEQKEEDPFIEKEEKVTLVEVKDALMAVKIKADKQEKDGNEMIRSLLKPYNVSYVKDLKEEHYASIIEGAKNVKF